GDERRLGEASLLPARDRAVARQDARDVARERRDDQVAPARVVLVGREDEDRPALRPALVGEGEAHEDDLTPPTGDRRRHSPDRTRARTGPAPPRLAARRERPPRAADRALAAGSPGSSCPGARPRSGPGAASPREGPGRCGCAVTFVPWQYGAMAPGP